MQLRSNLRMRITSVLVTCCTPLPAPSQALVQGREALAIGDTVPPAPGDHPDHLQALRCRVHRLSVPLRSTIKTIPTGWFPSHSRVPFLKLSTKHGSLHLQILFPCPPSSLCFRSLHHRLSLSLSLLLFLLLHQL